MENYLKKEPQPSREWQEVKNKFDKLCDEQNKLYNPNFEKVMKALYKIDSKQQEIYNTNGWNMGIDLPDEADTAKIQQALKTTGFSNDEAFCKDFMRYADVVIEGKKNMQQRAILNLNEEMQRHKKVNNPDEWQFYPISIIAPQELHPIIENIRENDAKEGKGLFANKTSIQVEDEDLDELLMIDAFGLKCSFVPFLDELKQYKVAGEFLSNVLLKSLFQVLNGEATFIKDNTDNPAKVKNHITNTIKVFDQIPIWGLFIQILILQGLCRWLEGININDGDNGYNETQSLYDWIVKRLIDKELQFCFVPYSEGDKEQLKPLCNYLYSTEIGQMMQNRLFPKEQPQSEQSNDKTTTGNQPPHFNGDYTDEELTATFEKLKQGKYIHSESNLDTWKYICTGREEKAFTEPINWTKSGVLLGMFVQDLFSITDNTAIWELSAKCFTVKGKTPNTNSIKVSLSKIKKDWKDRPKDYDKMQNEIIKDIK